MKPTLEEILKSAEETLDHRTFQMFRCLNEEKLDEARKWAKEIPDAIDAVVKARHELRLAQATQRP